jgi:tetratricopeptide (TPR) repeat protein
VSDLLARAREVLLAFVADKDASEDDDASLDDVVSRAVRIVERSDGAWLTQLCGDGRFSRGRRALLVARLTDDVEAARAALDASPDDDNALNDDVPNEALRAALDARGLRFSDVRAACRAGRPPLARLAGLVDDDLAALQRLGAAALEGGRLQDAREIFAGLEALDPDEPARSYHAAVAAAAAGAIEEAVLRATRALERLPKGAPLHDDVVELLEELRDSVA